MTQEAPLFDDTKPLSFYFRTLILPVMSTRQPSVSEDLLRLSETGAITVLHVDDEPEFADLVSIYLERENSDLEVITEQSAEAGLERLGEADIDCIVSDYDMPKTDGLEFLDAVRDSHPDLPFILFTGKGSEEIASEAISAGVTDYLQKASGTDQYVVLANRITNAVRQHRAEQEIDRGFQALESAREGISLLDEEGKFLYVNRAYADTYGYDREELVGEHWEMLYPDDGASQVYEEVLPAVPEEGRWQGEHVHLKKDGTRVVVDHALARAQSGTLICLIQDLTDEKQAQRTLQRERTRFELFIDAVEEYAIFSLDPDGHVTSWNRGAARIKGYEQDEILGEHFSTFYPEAKNEAGSPDQLLAEALEEGWVKDEGWRIREDGTQFWASVVITAVFDEDDTHRGFVKITKDLTDQLGAQEVLTEEQQVTVQALDVLEDVFYVIGPEGSIDRVNDRAVEVLGYSRDEFRSMDAAELFPEDQRAAIKADIEEALATGSAHLEADLVNDDGRTIPYEFRNRRLTDEDGSVIGMVGIGRDITERRRRERQLQRQLAQFEHFGSVLSHDLRTPLSVIKGRLELARETNEPDHLEQAEKAVERLDQLIDDLAAVMHEGELVSEFSTVDIEDCVRSVWESLATDRATLRIAETAAIRADEDALTRLFENLIKNAIEHGDDDVTVTVGTLRDGFYVENDGPEIPEAIRDEIFEVGYSTKQEDESTGYGLASVRQITVAHGWEITATEGADGGARFEITDVEKE
jgi:PAS domain S-box-containing protein